MFGVCIYISSNNTNGRQIKQEMTNTSSSSTSSSSGTSPRLLTPPTTPNNYYPSLAKNGFTPYNNYSKD